MTADSNDRHRLPAALRPAPIEFDTWSKERLLVEQAESSPTEPLYHYTGDASLRGILGRERLWCFSHLDQSDKTEFEYALAIARDVMRQVGTSDDFFTKHFCACLEDVLETNGLATPFEFYLFSLSRHRNHARQWREFGQSGRGFAIGFSPTLFLPDKDDLYQEANRNIHIGRVLYGHAATASRHRLTIERAAEITSRYGRANPEAVREAGPSRYLVSMVRELLASQLVWNCLTAKHERYADEREVRGIIMNVKANFDPWRRVHAGRRYVEYALALKPPGAISEILIGPLAPSSAEVDLRAFLRAQAYPDIPIVRSVLPL